MSPAGYFRDLLQGSVDLLRQMVAVPSPSFKEGEVRAIVTDFLDECGIAYTLLGNNIIAFSKGFSPRKKTLMLCAHLDTVSPVSDYEFDPYNPDYGTVAKVLGLSGSAGARAAGTGSGAADGAASAAGLASGTASSGAAGFASGLGTGARAADSPGTSTGVTNSLGTSAGVTNSLGTSAGASSAGAADDKVVAGLGSNDDGGSVVALIAAFRYFRDEAISGKDLPLNLLLVLSAEEERSGQNGMQAVWNKMKTDGMFSLYATTGQSGAAAAATGATTAAGQSSATGATANAATGSATNAATGATANSAAGSATSAAAPMTGITPDWAIVGEPTGMKAAKAERGLLVIDGVAEGVSGHAARGEGVNALYIAMDDIQKLRALNFDKISPLLGETRLTVTQINAGTAHNVIPDRCSFVVDIRPTEQYTNGEILGMLQGMCRSRLTARNLTNRSSATPKSSPLLKAAASAGIETFISPTTSDWMRIGCDAIKMGPGESSRSHHKNEYVTVSEISDGIRKYIEFIRHFSAMAGK